MAGNRKGMRCDDHGEQYMCGQQNSHQERESGHQVEDSRAVNRTVYGYGRICMVSIRVWAVPYFTHTYIFSPFDGMVR